MTVNFRADVITIKNVREKERQKERYMMSKRARK